MRIKQHFNTISDVALMMRQICLMYMLQTDRQIQRVDEMIGRLWNGLKERSMQDKINIIVVGDHGIVLARKYFCKLVYQASIL